MQCTCRLSHVPISPIHTQSEVASLAETSAQQQAAVFTPYLLPDALTLCTALHLIRKLLSSEKFIVIIAKSGMNDICAEGSLAMSVD